MYTMKFIYSGNHFHDYEHIEKVEYITSAGPVSVSGDDILSQDYPLTFDFHLISVLKSYKAPHNCLKSIEVVKE